MDAALFELLLFFGIVLGLACWELYSVTRSLRRPPEGDEDAADAAVGERDRKNSPPAAANERDRRQ